MVKCSPEIGLGREIAETKKMTLSKSLIADEDQRRIVLFTFWHSGEFVRFFVRLRRAGSGCIEPSGPSWAPHNRGLYPHPEVVCMQLLNTGAIRLETSRVSPIFNSNAS